MLGNEALLVTAVHNLISNAIQYSPDDSRVGIGVRNSDGVVEIAVTDQGVGIPEEDLDRVFERFFRVDQARSRNTGGTGLGLASSSTPSEPRRRRSRLVAARTRLDLHDPPARSDSTATAPDD